MKTSNVFSVLLPSFSFYPQIFFPWDMLKGEYIQFGKKKINIAVSQKNLSECRIQSTAGINLIKGRIDIKRRIMTLSDNCFEYQQAVVGLISEEEQIKALVALDVGTYHVINGCVLLCEFIQSEKFNEIKDDKTIVSLRDVSTNGHCQHIPVLRVISIGDLALRQKGISREYFEPTKLIAQ